MGKMRKKGQEGGSKNAWAFFKHCPKSIGNICCVMCILLSTRKVSHATNGVFGQLWHPGEQKQKLVEQIQRLVLEEKKKKPPT
jgi:hypothetical protein